MKRSLTLLLASLLLVFTLTACGGDNRQQGNAANQNGSAVTGETAGNNGTNTPADNNGTTNGITNGENATNGTVNNGTADNGNGSLVNDAGDVLEDIGNGTRDVLDDAGRALTGNNGTTTNPAANGTY